RDHVFHDGDREPLRHAGAAIDAAIRARLEGDALDQLRDEVRHAYRSVSAFGPRFLLRDLHAERYRGRVVRLDLASDTILERRDDLAASRVVLGVRREDQLD